jgi:ribosomal protein S12 methylthiotransferase
MTKVGFVSLGCPKNLVDSEVMMGILTREGYELTPRAEEAEILVVNTCSFIESAQKESVETILEMAEHKKFGAAKKLIVAGCLVERFRDEILDKIPEVDAVVGTGEVERILEAAQGDLRVLPAAPPAFLYHELTPRIVTTPRHAAYIKIAEGCDHPCTFCIIPQLRGAFRSRRFESVVREAENLAAAGAREITLIGQDTTSYGEDLGLRDGLALLLESRDSEIAGHAGGASAACEIYGHATAACQPDRFGTHEARLARRRVFEIAGADSGDDSRRFAADFLHCGLPGRDRKRF